MSFPALKTPMKADGKARQAFKFGPAEITSNASRACACSGCHVSTPNNSPDRFPLFVDRKSVLFNRGDTETEASVTHPTSLTISTQSGDFLIAFLKWFCDEISSKAPDSHARHHFDDWVSQHPPTCPLMAIFMKKLKRTFYQKNNQRNGYSRGER
ncbi:hypothetical protein V3C99_016569 [Haemonchus contortus]